MQHTETAEPNTANPAAPALHPVVHALLSSGALYIERDFAIQQYCQFLAELQWRAGGGAYADLGISQRRHDAGPEVLAADGELVENTRVLYYPEYTPANSMALIRLTGTMTSEGMASTPGASVIASNLRAAYRNPNIDAVILEINSGGGEASAMRMLQGVLSERNKPVISFAHFAASAAYGTAAATDEIIAANEKARFGSIGAAISIDKTLLETVSKNFLDFYGANAPNKNKPFRAALAGDFSHIQALANEETDAFQANVAALRPLRDSARFALADTLSGDVFTAGESKSRGLIDGLGNMNYAMLRARKWADKYKRDGKM